jgi:hypothetical protein
MAVALLPLIASGDSVNYFYDELGRLSRVSKGTSGVLYKYDDLGNLESITNHDIVASQPELYSIDPETVFNGSRMFVNISGINLFTTESVTSDNPALVIENVNATDTKITADMTAGSTGSATITVTTEYGTANIGVSMSGSALKMSPPQTALSPGSSGSLNLSIDPAIANDVRIKLKNSNNSVVSSPEWVLVPSSGSVNFDIDTIQEGVSRISAGVAESAIFVTRPFGGYTGITTPTSKLISVAIDSPSGSAPATATPISVSIDQPTGSSPATASPVSVSIDSPAGNSPAVSAPLSVAVDSPSGDSPAVSDLISVGIEP